MEKQFALVEAAVIFLGKRRLGARVGSVCSIVNNLAKGSVNTLDLETVRKMCTLLPEVMKLEYVPDGAVNAVRDPQSGPSVLAVKLDSITYYLEILFLKPYHGSGKVATAKRAKLLAEKLKSLESASRAEIEACSLPLLPNGMRPEHLCEAIEEQMHTDNNTTTTPILKAEKEDTKVSQVLQDLYCKKSNNQSSLDLEGILRYLREVPFYKDQIVHVEPYEKRQIQEGRLEMELHPALSKVLKESLHVNSFFSHQSKAIDASRRGHDIVVSTATSSGKSLIFSVPVFQSILENSCAIKHRTEGGFFSEDYERLDDCEGEGSKTNTDEESPTFLPPRTTALYIFPTKALAQDQLGSAQRIADNILASAGLQINIKTFDGDTPQCDRDSIRMSSDIIITNPDMLHVTLLPHHQKWKTFLRGLRFVVIDEAHTYHGAFGSHVACVLKRFLRVCSLYSEKQPQFFCCSATIGNPLSLFQHLVSSSTNPVTIIGEAEDGSPCGRRLFGIWNPPLLELTTGKNVNKTKGDSNNSETSENRGIRNSAFGIEGEGEISQEEENRRKSSIFETALLLSALVRMGVKTMAFCRTRKLTELVLRYTHDELKTGYRGKVYPKPEASNDLTREFCTARPNLASLVAGYRGGYQLSERREIEEKLFSGKLLAVTATCALELGIDVGHLDAVILLGYPGSSASMWQQVGRAGRSGKDALALFICFNGPVDQYFIQNPRSLLDKSRVEDAVLDPLNKYVLKDHLLCALRERALVIYDDDSLNEDLKRLAGCFSPNLVSPSHAKYHRRGRSPVAIVRETLDQLVSDKLVVKRLFADKSMTTYSTHPKLQWPTKNVNLRVIDPVTFELYCGEKLMDTIPYSRAFFELYPGAIYMHQGRSYLVSKMDLSTYRAYAHPTTVSYYTAPRDTNTVNIKDRFEAKREGINLEVSCGAVQAVTSVWGYRKMWLRTGRVFEMHEFTLPPIQFETQAVWVDISTPIQEKVIQSNLDLAGGIHAINHLLKKLVTLYVVCHHQNVSTEHVAVYFKRPQPTRIILYDNCPGGLGASESAFEHFLDLLKRCHSLVNTCSCSRLTGCPGCISDLGCSGYNAVLDKESAKMILTLLLEGCWERTRSNSSDNIGNPKRRKASPPNTPQKRRAEGVGRAMGMGRARMESVYIATQWAEQHPNHSEGIK